MRLGCLIFLAVMSAVVVAECKPLSEDVEKAPCIDCKQKQLGRKRTFHFVFAKAAQEIKLNLGCDSCFHKYFVMSYLVPVNRSPDIHIGNGQNNVNHVVINGANNVYIGNGAHNTNYVSHG